MNDIENILDLNASEIDEIIQALKEIEDLALSSDGLGQINMVIDLFENNLDGLYKKAMVEQVKTRKQVFIEVIEELRDRRIRLERYRKFLQSGAGVKVVQNQNYINVNPMEDIKNASDLELAVGTLIPRIEDDYDVIREADNRIYELEGIIASKLRQEPPGDVSHERELISILNTNKGLFNALDSSIPKALNNTSKMPEEFDEVNKLFRTNLDNYHTLWDGTTNFMVEEINILSGIGEFFSNLFWKDDEKEKMKSCPPPEGVYGPPGPDFCGMNGKDKAVFDEEFYITLANWIMRFELEDGEEFDLEGSYTPYEMAGDEAGVYTFPGGIAGIGEDGAYEHLNNLLGEKGKYALGDEVPGDEIVKAIENYNKATIEGFQEQLNTLKGVSTIELSDNQWIAICDAAYPLGRGGLYGNNYININSPEELQDVARRLDIDSVEEFDLVSIDVDESGEIWFSDIVYKANQLMDEGKNPEAEELINKWFDYDLSYATNEQPGHKSRLEEDADLFVNGFPEQRKL